MTKPPPWPLLQTVEAVVRLGSFKLAAEELLVTPSAVSHRIRAVEESLHQALFDRVGQGISPRDTARGVAKVVRAASDEMLDVWRGLQSDASSRPLRVSCMATFANHFLLPSLDDLKLKFPKIELETHSVMDTLLRGADRPDILIGLGSFPEHDWWHENVLELAVRPVCSADAIANVLRDGKLVGPLLGFASTPQLWVEVAKALDLELDPSARLITFDSMHSACLAASNGVGVALAPDWVISTWAGRDQLIVLGDRPVSTGQIYWLAVRRGHKNMPPFQRFRRWLRSRIVRAA